MCALFPFNNRVPLKHEIILLIGPWNPEFLKEIMSIPYSGTIRRSEGVVSAIGKQLKGVNLKAAQRITVKFDPFSDNVRHTRYIVQLLSIHSCVYLYLNKPAATEVFCLVNYFFFIAILLCWDCTGGTLKSELIHFLNFAIVVLMLVPDRLDQNKHFLFL